MAEGMLRQDRSRSVQSHGIAHFLIDDTMKNVRIRIASGQDYGREIPIHGQKFVVGRAPDCDFRPSCPWIGRYHCELILDEKHVTVRHTDGKQETFVNGQRVDRERRLRSGDRVGVGWSLFDVCFDRVLAGPECAGVARADNER